jgi:uncharacterized membrane protein YebE (DUF533 family)
MWMTICAIIAGVLALASGGGQAYDSWQEGNPPQPSLGAQPPPAQLEQRPPGT